MHNRASQPKCQLTTAACRVYHSLGCTVSVALPTTCPPCSPFYKLLIGEGNAFRPKRGHSAGLASNVCGWGVAAAVVWVARCRSGEVHHVASRIFSTHNREPRMRSHNLLLPGAWGGRVGGLPPGRSTCHYALGYHTSCCCCLLFQDIKEWVGRLQTPPLLHPSPFSHAGRILGYRPENIYHHIEVSWGPPTIPRIHQLFSTSFAQTLCPCLPSHLPGLQTALQPQFHLHPPASCGA